MEDLKSRPLKEFMTVRMATDHLRFKHQSRIYQLCKSGALRYCEMRAGNGSAVKMIIREDVVKYETYITDKRTWAARKQ